MYSSVEKQHTEQYIIIIIIVKVQPDQCHFPQKQQDFLHGEVWGAAAAEPGYHGEQHDGQGVFSQCRLTCNSHRPNDEENNTAVSGGLVTGTGGMMKIILQQYLGVL